jgi:hypothetical protein
MLFFKVTIRVAIKVRTTYIHNFELWTVKNLEIKLENQQGAMIINTPCCNPTMFVQ